VSFAFVYLARDAGPTFEALAHDIAGVTRPGDLVLVVEDSNSTDTPARIGRFTEQVGWGAGVAVHRSSPARRRRATSAWRPTSRSMRWRCRG
jgi:hypothetical protein